MRTATRKMEIVVVEQKESEHNRTRETREMERKTEERAQEEKDGKDASW